MKPIPNINLTKVGFNPQSKKVVSCYILIFNPLSLTFWVLFISPQDVLLSCALEHDKSKGEELQSPDKNAGSNINVKRNYTTENDRRPKAVTARKKIVKTGSKRASVRRRSDATCTKLGGICQPDRYICQGRYLKDKCLGAKTRQCCMPGMVTQLHVNANTYQHICKHYKGVINLQHMGHFIQTYAWF